MAISQKEQKELAELLREAYVMISPSESILLAAHEHPDADALGSMLAMHSFLKKSGIMSIAYCKDYPRGRLRFLPHVTELKTSIPPDSSFDTIIGFDYGDFRRLHVSEEVISKAKRFITFDHHIQGDSRGDLKIVYPTLSSTSELMYRFFKANDIHIDRDIALLILTGIIADTGGFKHITTSPEVFSIASDLLKMGILPARIFGSILNEDAAKQFPIWGRALARLEYRQSFDMAFSFLVYEDFIEFDAVYEDASGVISLINTVTDAKFSLLLVEYEKDKIKGSLRSEPFKGVDVSKIARSLGGGGHKYASGFSHEGSVASALRAVEEAVGLSKKTYDIMPA